ncbi:uncharacterized protein LOC107484161 [Arachis duranensis]|uniref:Uncharacterized protein LOC107484161 n=1 Tax=Arachis duranensis TaxID=130453 RepID=A0A9C6TLL5_ARADU|nr:uncharacterized protein LOC107484161 [Arachis duranensis]
MMHGFKFSRLFFPSVFGSELLWLLTKSIVSSFLLIRTSVKYHSMHHPAPTITTLAVVDTTPPSRPAPSNGTPAPPTGPIWPPATPFVATHSSTAAFLAWPPTTQQPLVGLLPVLFLVPIHLSSGWFALRSLAILLEKAL